MYFMSNYIYLVPQINIRVCKPVLLSHREADCAAVQTDRHFLLVPGSGQAGRVVVVTLPRVMLAQARPARPAPPAGEPQENQCWPW